MIEFSESAALATPGADKTNKTPRTTAKARATAKQRVFELWISVTAAPNFAFS